MFKCGKVSFKKKKCRKVEEKKKCLYNRHRTTTN